MEIISKRHKYSLDPSNGYWKTSILKTQTKVSSHILLEFRRSEDKSWLITHAYYLLWVNTVTVLTTTNIVHQRHPYSVPRRKILWYFFSLCTAYSASDWCRISINPHSYCDLHCDPYLVRLLGILQSPPKWWLKHIYSIWRVKSKLSEANILNVYDGGLAHLIPNSQACWGRMRNARTPYHGVLLWHKTQSSTAEHFFCFFKLLNCLFLLYIL